MLKLSNGANKIIEQLNINSYECYAVGGCVRDLLRNEKPEDYDFATNATPDEILSVFKEYTTYDIGKKFGTIGVVIDDKKYEITTYRSDGDYLDSRHPENVKFSKNLSDDLSRRDFTINALAYSDNDNVIDLFGGQSDLNEKIIKCVGDPYVRFKEDALRILRALRFASTFGFSIEDNTKKAMFSLKDNLNNIAKERIFDELIKILLSDNVKEILLEYRDIFGVIIPELIPTFGYDQNSKHHSYDLYTHTIYTVSFSPKVDYIRFTMLLHDLGKVKVRYTKDGISHYKGHAKVSYEMAEGILSRFKSSNKFKNDVLSLILYHDVRFKADNYLIKLVLNKIGPDLFIDLMEVQKADTLSQSMYMREEKLQVIDDTIKEYRKIIDNNEGYTIKDLKVNGNDILSLGIVDEKNIGTVLDKILDLVISNKIGNNREELLKKSKEIIDNLDK